MNWVPSLSAWPFAAAGVVAAVATLLLHLLRRRAAEAMAWGAMDFLRAAVRKQRRYWQLRDALLLLLRTTAVLLFGFALARPYYSASGEPRRGQPVHAILVFDNSLSMAYETLQGSLVEQARQSARNLMERLPVGSRISLLAGVDWNLPTDSFTAMMPDQALAAIDQIELVDDAADLRTMLLAAQEVSQRVGDLPALIVLLGDGQAVTFQSRLTPGELDDMPPVQLVDLSGGARDNTWVAEVRVTDEFAIADVPTTIMATIERRGGAAARVIDVSCEVAGEIVATKTVTLEADTATKGVSFSTPFPVPENGLSTFNAVPVRISITPDRLQLDDVAYVAVPVVERLPVLFVDNLGARENARLGPWGETRSMRRLLHGEANSTIAARDPLTAITIDELNTEALDDIRLLVLAGVSDPQDKVPLLRSFVARGGRLLIAAGGNFQPALWTEKAWLNGDGVLPAPLQSELLGTPLSQVSGALNPLSLSFDSLTDNPLVRFPGASNDELRSVYAEPLFFQVVQTDEAAVLGEILARFNDNAATPFVIERPIGTGKVVFLSTGLTSDWNTLPRTNAVLLLDRLARRMIAESLPAFNRPAQADLTIPLPPNFRGVTLRLLGPTQNGPAEELPLTWDDNKLAVHFPAVRRGVYELQIQASNDDPTSALAEKLTLAVQGDLTESDLTAASDRELAELSRTVDFHVVTDGAELSVANSWNADPELWWWLILVVFVLLAAELVVLVAAKSRRPRSFEVRAVA